MVIQPSCHWGAVMGGRLDVEAAEGNTGDETFAVMEVDDGMDG